MVLIAPSILSADYANLEAEIKKLEAAGADYVVDTQAELVALVLGE